MKLLILILKNWIPLPNYQLQELKIKEAILCLIRNKIGDLKFLISSNVDVLVISETELDESCPTSQFQLEGFEKPFQYDRNAKKKFQQIA